MGGRIGLLITIAMVLAALPQVAQAAGESVRTIAGSGGLGMADGAAAAATFLVPTGIARGRDGTIYVSDEAANRIRAIKNGVVSTVAGSGDIGPLGMSVIGGYTDGPALSARFNHPMGLAVGRDGAVYIADALNKKIRMLDHGIVTTVVDALVSPQDIAFDRSGNLWIASYGGGVKRWDGHALTTVPLPNLVDKVLAVTVSPDVEHPMLIVVTPASVVEYDLTSAAKATASAPYSGVVNYIPIPSAGYGNPRQIVALGNHQVVISDPVTNCIRYLRFQINPLVTQPYTTPLAGGTDERGITNAGFADGPDARFYSPRGILLDGPDLIIADGGNRRIRAMRLPPFRTSELGLGSGNYDTSHYEIVLIGPSFTFWNSRGDDDSICGAIERRLNESHRIAKPVRCHTVRIDSAHMPQMEDYIDNFLAFKHVDMYIFMQPPEVAESFPAKPQTVDAALAAFRVSLRHLLDTTKARLLLVWWAQNWQISDTEDLVQRQTDYVTFPDDDTSRPQAERVLLPVVSGMSNVAQYDLFSDLLRYESGSGLPLYDAPDTHPNARGNVFAGEHIADAVLRIFLPAAH